jgi:hypothetical protein
MTAGDQNKEKKTTSLTGQPHKDNLYTKKYTGEDQKTQENQQKCDKKHSPEDI